MNAITPINSQKVSYLKNNQPQSLSVQNAAGQSSGDAYVPQFKGYEKSLSNKKGLMAALLSLVALFTGIFVKKNAEEEKETLFKKNLANKVSSEEIKALLLSKKGEIIKTHGGNLIEEIKCFEESIESAQNDFDREDIKQALIDTAAELYGEVYGNANRPSYYSKHFANAQSIKEALLEKRGIKIDVEYDDYYGRLPVRKYYTYNGKEFDIPKSAEYNETLNKLINESFSGKLSENKSVFE